MRKAFAIRVIDPGCRIRVRHPRKYSLCDLTRVICVVCASFAYREHLSSVLGECAIVSIVLSLSRSLRSVNQIKIVVQVLVYKWAAVSF